MKKIKLLFVSEELAINGATISLLRLMKNLPQECYDVSLFVFNHGGELFNDIPSDINIISESLPYKIHRLPLKKALRLSIKKGRIDLALYRILVSFQRFYNLNYKLWAFLPKVKGEYDVAISYNDGFVAPMILRKTHSRKKACWIHSIYSKWPQPEYVYDALLKSDIRVPVSIESGNDLDKVLETHTSQYIVHNITDVETCIRLAEDHCDMPKKHGVIRIVSVGRVADVKNFGLIPEIAEILNKTGLIYEWIIVGDGDKLKTFKTITKEKGLEAQIFWIGAKKNPMPYIKSADVFVNPSRFESWGMTVSEALCLGKVVITSNIPVFSEQIDNGVNGIMSETTPEVLSNNIIRILENKELRERIEQKAVNYKFTKEFVVREFNHMIRSLIND